MVDRLQVKLFRVELSADPFEHLFVLFVLRVPDGFEKIGIAVDSAAVFGRAGARAVKAARVTSLGIGRKNFFKHDLMLPAVAKVILVNYFSPRHGEDLIEPHFPFVPCLGEIIGVRNAVIDSPDDELVQVAVEPAHDLLNDPVELGKRDIAPDLKPPPDRGAAFFERDLQLINLHLTFQKFTALTVCDGFG